MNTKSTLLNLVLGVHAPTAGRMTFLGRDLVAHGPRREDPMSGPADPLDDEDADELALTYGERVRRLLGRG